MRLNVTQNRRIIRLRRIMRRNKPETHKTVAQKYTPWKLRHEHFVFNMAAREKNFVFVSGQTLNNSSLPRCSLTTMIPFTRFYRETGTVVRRSRGKYQKELGKKFKSQPKIDTSVSKLRIKYKWLKDHFTVAAFSFTTL